MGRGEQVAAVDLIDLFYERDLTARRLHLEQGKPVTVRGISTTTLGYWPDLLFVPNLSPVVDEVRLHHGSC